LVVASIDYFRLSNFEIGHVLSLYGAVESSRYSAVEMARALAGGLWRRLVYLIYERVFLVYTKGGMVVESNPGGGPTKVSRLRKQLRALEPSRCRFTSLDDLNVEESFG